MVIVKNANNSRTNSVIPSLIRGAIASKQKELQKEVAEARDSVQLWKVIDKDPHILHLLDAVKENDYLSFGNSLEDLALLYSIRSEVPIACFDLDEVCGDIELTKATGAEPFRPRSSIKLEHAVPNEVIYRDRAGAITRQWAKNLSQRTGLTTDTHNAAWIIETIGDISLEKMKNLLKEMERTIKSYCGGTIEMAIIGETITEIDLGVTGKTGLNDADYKPDPRRLAFHQKLMDNFETTFGISFFVFFFGDMSLVVMETGLMINHPRRKTERVINLTHPNRIAAGEIIVHGNHMNSLTGKGIEINR